MTFPGANHTFSVLRKAQSIANFQAQTTTSTVATGVPVNLLPKQGIIISQQSAREATSDFKAATWATYDVQIGDLLQDETETYNGAPVQYEVSLALRNFAFLQLELRRISTTV